MPSLSEIRALVSLLADEDSKIVGMVWEHLNRLGSEALPALREAGEGPDPRLRVRARHALQVISLDDVERTLQFLSSGDDRDFDLEGTFHALARIEYPDLSLEEVRWALDDLAALAQPRLAAIPGTLDKVRLLGQTFQGEMRFAGVKGSLRDVDAACINRVLTTRTGSPVTLGVVFLLLGKRLGLHLSGVGLPNHFLIGCIADGQDIYVDPFQAKIFTRREVVHTYLHEYYPKDSYIHWVGGREITVRALRSLILFYSKNQDKTRVRRLGRFLEIVQIRERTR